MLDIVKELIPLLDGAKNGAIWLVAAYFGLLLAKMLLTAFVIVFIVRIAARLLRPLIENDKVKANIWSSYQWDEPGYGGYSAIFSQREFRCLLRAIAGKDRYIHDSDIQRAIKTLEASKK